MNGRGNELKVGITLTVAGLILILGILWLGGLKFREGRYEFSVIFPEVGGLSPGDRVTVAGISSGEVVSLQLVNGRVVAEVAVDDRIKIPVDSRIAVASYGLIGAKAVAVRPGTSDEFVEPGETVYGVYEKGLGDVVADMGEALTEIRGVLKTADEAMSDVEGKRRVKETLENASEATADLKVAVADLRETAASLRSFVEQNRATADTAVDSAAVASQRFAQVMSELKLVSASLDSIVTRVEEGRGSLGKLIADDTAHDEFIAAIREVRDLVAEIKRNPKSFVRFSIF
jgi:phospholipid/cholesterol/gamma-HCH transport system substrate-binding protein